MCETNLGHTTLIEQKKNYNVITFEICYGPLIKIT